MVRNSIYFLKQAVRGLQEHRILALMTVLSISLTFLFSGLFFLVYINLEQLGGTLRGQVRMMVYLQDAFKENGISSLGDQLKKEKGVEKVIFLSKEDALHEYINELKGDPKLLEGLGENPFPASFQVLIEKSFQNSDFMEKLSQQIRQWEGVDEVRFRDEWVNFLNQVLTFLKLGGIWLGGLLVLGILAIVSTTIRLTVYARREEIQILKFMGATDRFIMAPFFIEGLFIGMIGSGFSLFLLMVFFEFFGDSVEGGFQYGGYSSLVFLTQKVMVSMLGAGILLGCLGSLISVRGVLREEF
ncbi:MAG TPA: permease-like cell division protein FtsX [Nitrospiria bacterium]|jgi:cell division transport system permease protein